MAVATAWPCQTEKGRLINVVAIVDDCIYASTELHRSANRSVVQCRLQFTFENSMKKQNTNTTGRLIGCFAGETGTTTRKQQRLCALSYRAGSLFVNICFVPRGNHYSAFSRLLLCCEAKGATNDKVVRIQMKNWRQKARKVLLTPRRGKG